mmetsp:Transcript_6389/g.12464  ORF Transcript_6389/g.12464 Transcript_6389/m.12464 type:complete len:441 (+) Transcript_6389:119-1441(+)
MVSMNAVYFTAATAAIDNSGITSNTVLFIPQWENIDIAPKDVVCFVGGASGLDPNVLSANGGGGTDCTDPNGCGVHVHSGTDCSSSTTQGGHWYNSAAMDVDPWALIGYEQTSAAGLGQFASCVHTGFNVASDPGLLDGRAFIVHRKDGSRASCGLISKAPKDYKPMALKADTVLIPGVEGSTTDTLGYVEVMANIEKSVADGVCYMGYAKGLEPNVESFLLGTGSEQCKAANGCGAHIHSGTSCETSALQGGHYYDSAEVSADPWAYESYLKTDSSGEAALIGCAITGSGAADYDSRPFIVHKPDGSRLLCGLLEGSSQPTPSPTPLEINCNEDKLSFKLNKNPNHNCAWAAKKPERRCVKKDKKKQKRVKYFCPSSCDLRCVCKNSKKKFALQKNRPKKTKCGAMTKKDCKEVAFVKNRKVTVADMCPKNCGACVTSK